MVSQLHVFIINSKNVMVLMCVVAYAIHVPVSWLKTDRNWLKKFMQVGVNAECMHTDFGGRGLSGFGDKISL